MEGFVLSVGPISAEMPSKGRTTCMDSSFFRTWFVCPLDRIPELLFMRLMLRLEGQFKEWNEFKRSLSAKYNQSRIDDSAWKGNKKTVECVIRPDLDTSSDPRCSEHTT